jgi:hypothetical protein
MTTFGNLDINAPTFEELKGGKYLRNIYKLQW